MKKGDFKPGQRVTYGTGPRLYSARYTGVVLADSEHKCVSCPTFLHVRVESSSMPEFPVTPGDLHHVDPEAVKAVNGHPVHGEVRS